MSKQKVLEWFLCILLLLVVNTSCNFNQYQTQDKFTFELLQKAQTAIETQTQKKEKLLNQNLNHVDVQSKRHRVKRATTNDCQIPAASDLSSASKVNSFDPPDDALNSFDMISMMWTGSDNATRVVGLLNRLHAISSNVYVRTPSENEFKSAVGLEDVTISMMERNPTDLTHVIIIGMKNYSYQSCVSKDSGVSYTCNIMLNSYAPAGSLMFKNHMVMTILKSEYFYNNDLVLVLSDDYGQTWEVVHHDVTAAVFQPDSFSTIFALFSVKDSNPFPGFSIFQLATSSQMRKIDVSGAEPSSAELVGLGKTTVTGFQYIGSFLHVVTQDEDGHKILKVSKDHGTTFTDSHLPTTVSGQYINLLDTADELTFAQVTSATDSTIGTLYTSGQNGLYYTNSLERHVADDFYKVVSMDGVYLTTQKGTDSSLITLISRDRGAVWSPITVKNCQQDYCTLQIYNKYLIDEHKTNNDQQVLAQAPHSSENARGLIVVQGVLARNIPYNTGTRTYTYDAEEKVGVFISGDGGYTWIQAPKEDLVGPHHLLIEDSGGVIQALPMDKPLENILFSVNEGTCWYKFPLPKEHVPKDFTIGGLATQPGQQSLRLGIIGHGTVDGKQDTWLIIDVDFGAAIPTPCADADFVDWDAYPHCYLGVKRKYRRVKKTSWCHLGPAVDLSSRIETCACSRKDYECDYGFVKQDTTENCVKDPAFKDEVTYCLDNKVHQLLSSGYRKLPGDTCDDTLPKALKINTTFSSRNTQQPCDDGDPSTYLDMENVKSRICGAQSGAAAGSSGKNTSNQGLVAATVILTLISTIFGIAFVAVFYKYRTLLRQYDYNTFENYSWEANTSNDANSHKPSSSSSARETARITDSDNTGRSYTTLTDRGVESDVDLLNL